MSEADERLPAGPRGKQGAQGDRGERGLSVLQGRAVVVLFAIAAGCGVGNLFWTSHSVDSAAAAQQSEQAAQQRQAATERAAQQRAGAAIEGKLCKSLEPLAALARLKPPAGNPDENPSRAYEQELSARLAPLAQLGPDIGCGR